MEAAKPWYKSMTVLALLAGLLLPVIQRAADFLGVPLPVDFDHNKLAGYLAVYLPMLVALWGRIRAKHQVTATKGTASFINGL